MTSYRIASSEGVELGTYEAESPEAALDAMARDAGYESQADALKRGVAPFEGRVVEVETAMSADALAALSEQEARTVTEYPGTAAEESALLRDLRALDSYEREEDVSGAGHSGPEARGYTDMVGTTWRIHVVRAEAAA